MADNHTGKDASGNTVTFASDDVSSVYYIKTKLIDGTTDSSTAVAVDVGVKANALRVAPASDITDATYIGDIKFGEALPAGTNAIGKLAANSGVDIGDVDILSIAAGDNNIGNVDIVTLPSGNLGQQAMAASLSVVPANNITDATYIGDIKFGEALPAGTNAIGKLAANSGVDIGDVDVTSIANGSLNGPGSPTIDSYTHTAINLTTGANQVLASSAASKQIWVYGYGFTVGDANGQTVSFQDEDDNALSGIMEFAQYGGMSVSPSGNFAMPIWKLATDKDLEIDITGGDVDGWIAYAVVSV